MTSKFFILVFMASFCFCAQSEPLLLDSDFRQGYMVMSPQKDIYTDRSEKEAIQFFYPRDLQKSGEPAWRLVQWGSDQSILQSSSAYKTITLGQERELILELNGQAEFSNHYLEDLDKYWPHLLMAQNIKSKKLNEYGKMALSLDAKLLFDHKNISAGYQPGIHAARFPIAIAIRNTLSGNIFWLSLVIYDDRYPQSRFGCQKCTTDKSGVETCHTPEVASEAGRWECPFDGNRWSAATEKKGTRKMIFRLPTKAVTQDNIHHGEWAHYEVDLMPHIKEGIRAARETRQLHGFAQDLRFYELSFFSMGWEITGLNHAAIAVKNISLTGL